jgi:tRNA nucleotidyltransferase (CCA-adding enzyme)
MRLEVLIAAIPTCDRGMVAENLQLSQTSCDRLSHLATAEAHVLATLPQCDRPSQAFHLLHNYDTETLVLICVRHPRLTSDRIWRYLTQWSQTQPPLNGHDLKQLGYAPGPCYREMLEALLTATLDRTIQTRQEAIAFLQQRYPLP